MAESADEVAVVGAGVGAPRASSPFVKLARLALGLALLGWVLAGVDWTDLLGLFGRIDSAWLLVLVLMTPLTVAVSVWKWQLLLHARGHRLSAPSLYGFYVLGQFFNHVLPTSVGGDVARGVAVGRRIGDTEAAFASIFVERLTGLGVLLVLTTLALIASPAARASTLMLALAAATVAGYLTVVGAILDDRLMRTARHVLGRFTLASRALERITDFESSLRAHLEHPVTLLAAFALSLLFHLGALFIAYAACRALGQEAAVWTVVVATLLAQTVAVLPLSIGGIGLMEWAFVTIFAASGLSAAAGAATMLTIRLNMIVFSCLGYLTYLMLQMRSAPTREA
jgi:uncharacterized protein (TIRG00374 family)